METLELMSLEERRARSALVVVTPSLGNLIGTYLQRYTRMGTSLPPHITLMNPFFAPTEVTSTVRQRIRQAVAAVSVFPYALTGFAAFADGVVYLTPEPVEPFVELITQLRKTFSEIRPYWDDYDTVIPHVSVVDLSLADQSDPHTGVTASIIPHLPLRYLAQEVVLLQRIRPSPSPWDIRGRFALSPSPAEELSA